MNEGIAKGERRENEGKRNGYYVHSGTCEACWTLVKNFFVQNGLCAFVSLRFQFLI